MRRFQFQLDPLLRLREGTERERQREVAAIERRRIAIEDQIRRQQEHLVQGREAIRDAMLGSVRLTDVRAHAGTVIAVTRRAEELVRQLAVIQKELDAARQGLLEASRARKALELLRDRRRAEWRVDFKRYVDREMDDITRRAACNEGRS